MRGADDDDSEAEAVPETIMEDGEANLLLKGKPNSLLNSPNLLTMILLHRSSAETLTLA